MKSIGKAAELVTKAVGALRRKAGVLRARLVFLASPRRRAVVFAGIARHIRSLTPRQLCQDDKTAAAAQQRQHYCRGGARPPLAPANDDDDDEGGLASVAAGGGCGGLPHHYLPVPAASVLLVVQDEGEGDGDGGSDGGCAADWTLALRSLFDDDEFEGGGHRGADGCLVAADGLEDEEETSSVMDVIRRRREGDGQEFRMEDEIDRAADMYITRVRRRITAQLEEEELI